LPLAGRRIDVRENAIEYCAELAAMVRDLFRLAVVFADENKLMSSAQSGDSSEALNVIGRHGKGGGRRAAWRAGLCRRRAICFRGAWMPCSTLLFELLMVTRCVLAERDSYLVRLVGIGPWSVNREG
jgi:hypothetical protein